MGANPVYESDDPTITNPVDGLKEFYFDGINDFLLIKEAQAGRGGLLLHHTMTVSIWIYSDGSPANEMALLSKVDKTNTSNSNKITFGIGPGETQWMTLSEPFYDGTLQNFSLSLDVSPSFASAWTLLTYQLEASDRDNSTLRLYVNRGNDSGLTKSGDSATWFDNLDAAGYIGCTNEYNVDTWQNAKFFKGFMYRLAIWNDIKTQSEIENFYTSSSYNHSYSCQEVDQNMFESCAQCEITQHDDTGLIEWDRAGCSQCYQGLCTQCTANEDLKCFACKAGAYLENNRCECYATYDDGVNDGTHACPSCADTCLRCNGGYNYQCTECDTNGYKQPNGDTICLDLCPYGYANNEGVCTGSAKSISFVFDLIQHNWTSGDVKLYSGSLESVEPLKDPYTYYLRGQYFDGINHLSTFDSTEAHRFNLHNQFTVQIWFLPYEDVAETLFSKTESDGTTLFVLFIEDGDVRTKLRRYPDSKEEEGTIATYSTSVWSHIVVVVDFDQVNVRTTVTGYIKSAPASTNTYDDFVFLDTATSEAALAQSVSGCCSLFKGYIYSINITTAALEANDFDDNLNLDATLWTCGTDQYQNSNGVCQSCQNCGSPHINGWDGCRDDFDCNVCDNALCLECSSFASGAVCPSCKSNTDIQTEDCVCDSVTVYDDTSRTCGCADGCATCTGLNRYSCLTCAAGYWSQPGANNLCLNFCPQGYFEGDGFCNFEKNIRDVITFDGFSHDGLPAKDRGHYFLNEFQLHGTSNDDLLNNSGTIDAFLRPVSYGSGVTVFHASTAQASSANSEDLMVLELNSEGKMSMRVYPIDTNTISRTQVSDVDITAGTSAGTWMHLALTWQFTIESDNRFDTRFTGYRNGQTTLDANDPYTYLESGLN